MRLAPLCFITLSLVAQRLEPLPWIGVPSRATPFKGQIQPEDNVIPKISLLTQGRKVELSEDGTLIIIDPKSQIIWRGSLPGRRLKTWSGVGVPLSFDELKSIRYPETNFKNTVVSSQADPRTDLAHLLWFLDDGETYLTCLNPVTLKVTYLKLPNVRDPRISFIRLGIHIASLDQQWLISWADLASDLKVLSTPGPQNPLGTAFKPFPSVEGPDFKKTRMTPYEDRPKPKEE